MPLLPSRLALAVALLAPLPTLAREEYLAPKYRPNAPMEKILAHVAPGADAFPLEKPAEEIGTRLAALAAPLREDTGADLAPFLSPGFEGAALRPTHEAVVSPGPLPA